MPGIFVLSALNEQGESNWPDRWPTAALLERQRLDPIAFASQYLMQPVNMSDNPLKEEWLSLVTMPPQALIYYIGVDPSPTGKTGTDYFAIAVVGLDPTTGRHYVIEAYREQIDPLDQAALIIEKARKYSARLIVIEAYSAQRLFTRYFFGESGLNIREAKGTNAPKGVRYAAMVPFFTGGKVFILGRETSAGKLVPHPATETFVREWSEWNDVSKRDDTIDAVGKALEAAGLVAAHLPAVMVSAPPPGTVTQANVASAQSGSLLRNTLRPNFTMRRGRVL